MNRRVTSHRRGFCRTTAALSCGHTAHRGDYRLPDVGELVHCVDCAMSWDSCVSGCFSVLDRGEDA